MGRARVTWSFRVANRILGGIHASPRSLVKDAVDRVSCLWATSGEGGQSVADLWTTCELALAARAAAVVPDVGRRGTRSSGSMRN